MNIQNEFSLFKNKNSSVFYFSIITESGMELFHSNETKNNNVSVLVAAIASATQSLQEHLVIDNTLDRFAITNSSQGYYIEKATIDSQNCLVFLAYKDEINPARLSWEFRKFVAALASLKVLENKASFERESYLFKNISDEEIERLFYGAEV
jgi:hypothetical protein